jgi:hypothetical protein
MMTSAASIQQLSPSIVATHLLPRNSLFLTATLVVFGLSSAFSQSSAQQPVQSAAVYSLSIAAPVAPNAAPAATPPLELPADQGCVNQGADRRMFAPVVCWMQRHMSWKSPHEPHFALIGKPDGANLGLAWPPYAVINVASGDGRWDMFRIGFRYDRTWRGYIFPTIAAKHVTHPLRY